MATLTGLILADFTTSLASALAVGATTGTLQSATDDDGVALPTGVYYFTLDGSNSSKEHIRCTLTGTALTAIFSISRQGVATSGVVRAHRLGASVSLTDFAHLKVINDLVNGTTDLNASIPLKYDGTATISNANHLATKAYADGLAIAGSPDSTTSTKGIGRVSVAPVSATIPIFVGDNDGRVPTQDENDALVGTSGAPSTSNKYITEADVSSAGVSGKVVRLNVTNYPVGDGSSITNTGLSSYTFGETISAGMPVYLKISDSKVYKASATASDELFWNYIGIAYESGIANDVKKVYVTSGSMITIPTLGATTTAISSASAVEQTNGSTANGYSPIYTGNFGQFGFISGATQGNIEKIVLTFGANTGTGGGSTQLDLYEVTSIDAATSMVIGASLGSVTVGSPVASSNNTYTFSSPVTIKPNTQYAIRITAAGGSGANYYTLNSNSTTISASFWANSFNSATAINKVVNDGIPQFNVFSTLTHNYNIGDYLYLGNTAGTFSFVGGTNKLVIGQIISATTIRLGMPSSRLLQGTWIIPHGSSSGTALPMTIPVLRNSVAVDMSIGAANASASHVDNVNFEIGRLQTKVTTLGDANGTGDYKITEIVTWGRGTITSTPSFASQNNWTTTAYFYK